MNLSFYSDPDARQLRGEVNRPLSAEGQRLKMAFASSRLDDHAAQATMDELQGHGFGLEQVKPGADYGLRRFPYGQQVSILSEIMNGVSTHHVRDAVHRMNAKGYEVMIRDRSRGLDPMAAS